MPTKIVVDCSTGIAEEIELSPEEVLQMEADAAKAEADRIAAKEEAAVKAAKKAELLAKLGISEEDAKLLLA